MTAYDAVVVGSGPNGLAAAITVAMAGRSVLVLEGAETIGGGTRTEELTLPGFRHDVCSAIHPLGRGSPFFAELGLEQYGLEWIEPPVQLAHPLDDGSAAVLYRDLDRTATELGRHDGGRYRWLVGSVVHDWEPLSREILGPVTHWPAHPLALARFGLRALPAATWLARAFEGPRAKALLMGMAGHAITRLDRPLTASFALVLAGAGHRFGWPVAKGGSAGISGSLAACLHALGGSIETGRPVRSLADLPACRAAFFDVMPGALARIAGTRLAGPERRKLERYQHGPGVFKVDYALAGPVPWTSAACRQAGTVHLAGEAREVARAELEVARGRHPAQPFVLVAQPSLIDPTRAPGGGHVLWAYCHVPNGTTIDMTGAIEAQIERFAPGFRDLILQRRTMSPADLEGRNPNIVGGDIGGGTNAGLHVLFRPSRALHPYRTPIPGIYLCSAATPPGGGVHGLCGYHAARDALRRELA